MKLNRDSGFFPITKEPPSKHERTILMPKKKHSSMRLFLPVCMALFCAVWTTGCAATIFTGALLVDRINLATLKTSLDGTVVDETGVPMKDVKLVARFSYPTWDYTRSKTKTERHIIDGKFDIWKLGYCDVDLSFYKVGYEADDYHLHGGFGLVENEENTLKQHDMRVVMRQIRPPAHPPIRLRTLQHLYEATDLRYDMKRKERRVLAFRSSKPVMPEYTFVPFGQKPDESQYLELDFLRDEQGGIVTREFPGAVDSRGETVKYPAIFLIRLHSDDPDDGFVLFEEGKSLAEQNHFDGKIRKWNDYSGEMHEVHDLHKQIIRDCSAAQSRMQDHFMELAPEDGYTRREIAIPIEEIVRIWDYGETIKTTWYSPYRFAFLRVGGRYAKILFMFGGTIDGRAKEVDSGELGDDFRAFIYYNVYLNPEKGDRELKEFY